MGIKYPQPKSSAESTTNRTAPPGLLRELGSAADVDYKTAPPGLLREPGSADIDYMTAPPGLLREPGSVIDNSNSYEQATPGLQIGRAHV